MAVLAALLVVHILVYEMPLRFGRETKPNGLLQATLALLVLVGAAQLGQLSLANYEHRTFPVGTGRDHFYSYTPNINDERHVAQYRRGHHPAAFRPGEIRWWPFRKAWR